MSVLTVEIPAENVQTHTTTVVDGRQLHRVPPQLRVNKNGIYDPVIVSLGPYHHGQPRLHQGEEFKDEVLNIMLVPAGGANDKGFISSKIMERVDEFRSFYGGISKAEYDDEALAEMMLRDAYFVVYYMQSAIGDAEKDNHIVRRLGLSGAVFMFRDVFMLENQIPFWVIKLLISLAFKHKDEGEAFLYNFLSDMNFGDQRLTRVPWEDKEQEPLHLLEAHRTTLVKEESSTTKHFKVRPQIFKFIWRQKKSSQSSEFEMLNHPFRSVADLKAKGIHLGPSSNCLKDIRFNSYYFYGKLQLPIWFVTYNTKVFFSNVIAFEMSPETDTDFAVVSYVNFMKSLIENPKDVKELREKGILFCSLENDEEVVKIFKEIDTYGASNEDIFQDVKLRINEHCASKAKTWMAELIYTYFRSPWTAIALFAAIFLLCLTFLQTYYTVRPPKKN